MKKSIYVLLAIFLSSCLPQGVQIPQSPLLKALEKKSGLIAYIGVDGNVYVTDQSASNTTQLTDDSKQSSSEVIGYQAPTWSLDGSQLAYVRVQRTQSEYISDLFVANVDDDTSKSVYTSETEHPFYLNWSPDNQNISALSSTTQDAMLLQNIPADGSERTLIDSGGPFYWSWAPDGNTMVVHKNGSTEWSGSQLSFLKLDSNVTEYMMDLTSASYQAPAWSPNGEFILLTESSIKDGQQIVLADSTGEIQKTVGKIDLNTAFAWAFDSEQFAYIAGTTQLNFGSLGSLHVMDVDGNEIKVIEDQVIAFFWSPNSKRLAYFVPYIYQDQDANGEATGDRTLFVQLNVLDVSSGEVRELFTYQPTDEFFSLLPYFDQYHQSTTIWSPDSNNMVISFIDTDGKPQIAIVPGSGQTQPRLLAPGVLGLWSWK